MFYICSFVEVSMHIMPKFIKLTRNECICIYKLMHSIVHFLKELADIHQGKRITVSPCSGFWKRQNKKIDNKIWIRSGKLPTTSKSLKLFVSAHKQASTAENHPNNKVEKIILSVELVTLLPQKLQFDQWAHEQSIQGIRDRSYAWVKRHGCRTVNKNNSGVPTVAQWEQGSLRSPGTQVFDPWPGTKG